MGNHNGNVNVGTIVSVGDGLNAYAQFPGAYGIDNTHVQMADVWACKKVVTGGALTIVVTFSQPGGGNVIGVELSGQDTVTFFGPAISAKANSNSPNSGATGVIVAPGAFVLGLVSAGGVQVLPTGPAFSAALGAIQTEPVAFDSDAVLGKNGLGAFDGVLAGSGVTETFNATIGGAHAWVCSCVTVLAAAPPTVVAPLLMLGLG